MKNVFLILMVFASVSLSQADGLRETIKVNLNQVPMIVRTSFEKDFGIVPDGGYWMARIEHTNHAQHSLATPIWYSFNKGKKTSKVEVRYSPNGELISADGIEAKSQSEPAPFSPEKKIG